MIKNILKRGSVIAFSFFILISTAYASSDITKEYTFKAKSPDKLEYKYDEEITEGFTKYKEKSVTYQIIKDNRDIIKKSFDGDAPESIEENGEKYILKGNAGNEKKTVTLTLTEGQAVPETQEEDGVTLKLKSKTPKIVKERVSLPARFYGEAGSNTYKFNGKYITLADNNNPVWSGFNTDVKSHLRLGNDYQVLNGYFVSGYKTANGVTYRDAVYTANRGTKTIVAVYESEQEHEYIYAGDDKKVEAKAVVIYEEAGTVIPTKVLMGAGAGILALALGIIIFVLKKRKEK